MKLKDEQIKRLESLLTELSQKATEAGYDDDESDLFENVVIDSVKNAIKELETEGA